MKNSKSLSTVSCMNNYNPAVVIKRLKLPGSRNQKTDSTVASVENQVPSQKTNTANELSARLQRRLVFLAAIKQIGKNTNPDVLVKLSIEQIEHRLSKLNSNWKSYQLEHLAIIPELPSADSADHQTEYEESDERVDEIGDAFRAQLTKLKAAATAAGPPPISTAANNTNTVPNDGRKNLTIVAGDGLANIPNTWGIFSGDYTKWHSFRDCFESSIHNKADLDPVRKFQYLLASVAGDAKGAIGSLRLTASNYDNAWKRLCNIYEDDYQAVQQLINELLKMPMLKHPSSHTLRKMVDLVHNSLAQLENFVETKQWDPFIVFLVISRLDYRTHQAWQTHRTQKLCESPDQVGKLIPSWAQLEAFLDSYGRTLMHASMCNNEENANAANKNKKNPGSGQGQQSSAQKPTEAKQWPMCRLCNIQHGMFRCTKFNAMTLKSRMEYLIKHKVCAGCLREAHAPEECPQRPCTKCQDEKVHNSVICPEREAEKQTALLVCDQGGPPKRFKRNNTNANTN